MNTRTIKLLGIAILGAVAVGTVGVTAFDSVPTDVPNWAKDIWTRSAALDPRTPREFTTPELAPGDTELVEEGKSDSLSPPDVPVAASPSFAGGESGSGTLRVGDKLRIGFYERMDFDEEKWGRQRPPRNAFQQRAELSGEYIVSDDATVSIPLLGSFSVAKKSINELQATLAGAAEALIGRKGFVTIAALERQPIYVLGPVKNPGAYKYAPGMTVLHAVALAGGLERTLAEPWARMEAVRETGKRHAAIDRTTRLMARVAVLKSEYAGGQPQVPPRLIEMIGIEAATGAVREQADRRRSILWMRGIRERAAEVALDNAKREVETLAGAISPFDENIKLRAGRVESIRTLKNNNIVANSVLVQAQSELSDVQERRQAAIHAVELAKYRYASAEQELARVRGETQVSLEQEIVTAEQDIADTEREIGSSEGVLEVVQAGAMVRNASTNETSLAYQIVRQGPQGAVIISSIGTASLEPGDLVRVQSKTKAGTLTRDAKLP